MHGNRIPSDVTVILPPASAATLRYCESGDIGGLVSSNGGRDTLIASSAHFVFANLGP